MRRLYVPPGESHGGTIVLPDAEARHARTVLRARAGDRFCVLDGQGRELDCEVSLVDRDQVALEVIEERRFPRPAVELVLVQGLIKRKAMDLLIEKASELGATRIVPVQCRRSVPGADRSGLKPGRWRDLAVAAMKQCGRPWLMEMDPLRSFDAALDEARGWTVNLVGGLERPTRPLAEALQPLGNATRLPRVGIWVGPEGDFSDDEYQRLSEAGFAFVRLGEHVLRSETAALSALARVSLELERAGLEAGKAGNS